MGVDQSVKTFVYVVRAIASFRKESWEAKIQGFWDLGSKRVMVEIFRKSSLVIYTSFEMGDLISDPSTLMCSVEKRYKPGLQILKVLEGEGLIRKWPRLSSICRWTDERFFVRPYADQLGEVFVEMYCFKREAMSDC
ncbi:hypothetical protein SASPL_133116 [Salvia splendens]|uniref:Uncharacterized protein n=1 Tax=Salvia splendens TaxID=180675 RepID=A0A8X8X4W6_SALSN|nr:hypothetical protein SASPL_133116 [Salvia splendens]